MVAQYTDSCSCDENTNISNFTNYRIQLFYQSIGWKIGASSVMLTSGGWVCIIQHSICVLQVVRLYFNLLDEFWVGTAETIRSMSPPAQSIESAPTLLSTVSTIKLGPLSYINQSVHTVYFYKNSGGCLVFLSLRIVLANETPSFYPPE